MLPLAAVGDRGSEDNSLLSEPAAEGTAALLLLEDEAVLLPVKPNQLNIEDDDSRPTLGAVEAVEEEETLLPLLL